jgi:hypothetical protein
MTSIPEGFGENQHTVIALVGGFTNDTDDCRFFFDGMTERVGKEGQYNSPYHSGEF